LIEIGNVVREFNIGNTKVKICNNYCLSPEESNKKIEKVSKMLSMVFRNMSEEKIIEINDRYEKKKQEG